MLVMILSYYIKICKVKWYVYFLSTKKRVQPWQKTCRIKISKIVVEIFLFQNS